MDQLRNILGILKKHHFWLLAGSCMISGLAGWSMASKSLSAAYTQKKANIEKAFSGLKSIRETDPFPNATWKEEVAKLKDKEQQLVTKAATALYDEQKEILEWPSVLGPEFLNKIKTIPPGGEIPKVYCDLYAANIRDEIKNLLAIIKATPEVLADNAGGNNPPPRQPDDGVPRVVWSDQAQVQRLLDWKGRSPPSAEIWLAQEDLWVYASVLRIIAKINGDRYVLPIPRIDSLTIGAKAADALERGMGSGHIEMNTPAAGSADGGQGGGGPPPVVESDATPAPDEGRYVDANGKALPSGGAAKEQFKRMPVHMRLSIDQRQVLNFLVACANSPLPIEVRQLRIGLTGKAAAGAAKSSDNSGRAGGQSDATRAAESHAVPLELGGIIYIYSKPETPSAGDQPSNGQPPVTASAGPAPSGTPGS